MDKTSANMHVKITLRMALTLSSVLLQSGIDPKPIAGFGDKFLSAKNASKEFG